MARLIESKFLVIEGKGSEFLQAGFGGGPVQEVGVIKSGLFAGFSMINVGVGETLVCDTCNSGILPSETCYYIAVLNRLYCSDCFKKWHDGATYYPEDAVYERRQYQHTEAMLIEAGIEIEKGGRP
jgi:hypothetical protein